jgi:hypothetical protein
MASTRAKRSVGALAAAALFLISSAAGAVERGVKLDAELIRSNGDTTRLSSFWGKPVVMFYENPDSAKLNLAAKAELKRLSDQHHLRKSVGALAVVNLEGLNWWPARPITFGVVRGEEQKNKLPILIDLHGAMRKAPWKLDPHTSTVLVISAEGEVLYQASGKIEGAAFEQLTQTLRALLSEPLATR